MKIIVTFMQDRQNMLGLQIYCKPTYHLFKVSAMLNSRLSDCDLIISLFNNSANTLIYFKVVMLMMVEDV